MTKSLPNLLVIPVSSLFKIDYKSSFNFGANFAKLIWILNFNFQTYKHGAR